MTLETWHIQDEVGVVINDAGQPAQSALTFPSTPIALAASGLYILAACADGVHVYDRTSAAWVQSLPYPEGALPSPGQPIHTAYNNKGSCVLFAGLQKVICQILLYLQGMADTNFAGYGVYGE